jgi:hypothetical protein
MKAKPACALLTAVAFPALVATALAQAPFLGRGPGPNNVPHTEGATVVSSGGPQGVYELHQAPNPYQLSPVPTPSFGLTWKQPGPEEMALAKRADELIHQLETASTDLQRSEFRTRLGDVLTKQFDARQKRHRQEIEALEAKVAKLKELVNKRQASREEIVTRRLEQIVRDSQGLGW